MNFFAFIPPFCFAVAGSTQFIFTDFDPFLAVDLMRVASIVYVNRIDVARFHPFLWLLLACCRHAPSDRWFVAACLPRFSFATFIFAAHIK